MSAMAAFDDGIMRFCQNVQFYKLGVGLLTQYPPPPPPPAPLLFFFRNYQNSGYLFEYHAYIW